MSAVDQPDRSHKRKRDPSAPAKERGEKPEKPASAPKSPSKEPPKPSKSEALKKYAQDKPDSVSYKEDARTAKERRLAAKEIVEVRKMKRKPNYNLEKLLVCIISVVDDKRLVTKIIIRELQKMPKELILDRNGRRTILQLLHPFCPRYFGPDDLACLNLSIPSLITQVEVPDAISRPSSDKHSDVDEEIEVTTNDSNEELKNMRMEVEGKKDLSLRRYELLVESQLAEGLVRAC